MSRTPISQADVICRAHDGDGREITRLTIVPANGSSLTRLDPHEAHALGEAEVQLVEAGRYEYQLAGCVPGLAIRCPPLFKAHRLQAGEGESGVIETGTFCGQLRVEIVQSDSLDVAGSGTVEVRSTKLGYRNDYRWMLDDIAGRLMSLLHDARAPVRMPLATDWSRDPAHLAQQVAFLGEHLASIEFEAAIRRVLAFPRHQLAPETAQQPIGRAFKADRHLARNLTQGGRRTLLPTAHALARQLVARGIAQPSVPVHVSIIRRRNEADIPENQFVRHALITFQAFLHHAESIMRGHGDMWVIPAARARRAANELARVLSHAFFQQLSPLRAVPAGSAILQRQSGYREIFRAWLRFWSGAQLMWDASPDLFRAGQRNVATLYEYWTFFQLLDWFCARFKMASPPAQSLLASANNGDALICTLRHGLAIGPMTGTSAGHGLHAQLYYNRTFNAGEDAGSWTRTMRPDITLTLWPAGIALDEAHTHGRALHLHFDAKYRASSPAEALGQDKDGLANGATRDDLLKMHAYRDAIHNTSGAYVLYPGDAAPLLMRRGDGRLPSLGAFALTPGPDGRARGIEHMAAFLEEVMTTTHV